MHNSTIKKTTEGTTPKHQARAFITNGSLRRARALKTIIVLLLWLAGNISLYAADWYVATTGSNANAGTSGSPFLTISHAVSVASSGDNIFVDAGTYTENVLIDKSLTIRSTGGRAVTFITPFNTANNGTVALADGISNITFGGIGQGFTVTGFDGTGGIEASAVYLSGSSARTNTAIIGNEMIAAGDEALLADFNAAFDGVIITDNIFSGKTFLGAEPGGCGFSTQFDPGNNVPRGLVVLGGGASVTNSKNVSFINNTITGTAGGFNTGGGCEQGNTLVTIDVIGATIAQNTFSGTTTRFSSSLRARGQATSVYCNTFDNTGLGAACDHIFFGSATPLTGATFTTLAAVASGNAFPNGGAYLTPDNALSYAIYRTVARATTVATTIAAGQTAVVAATSLNCPVTNLNTGHIYPTIQSGVNDVTTLNTHVLEAAAGTYNEDVTVSKSLTIQSAAGYATTTVSGPIGGGGATFSVQASGVVIDGFTITRAGNNTTDWTNPGLNSAGVSVQTSPNSAEIKNCLITGNRTGIDINNSNGNNIHNNIIDFNRTGMILRNQTDNTTVVENKITDNWTAGILFLDASGGTNVPVQTALNSNFGQNNISANWYAQVVERQSGGSLPTPGTTNLKKFKCNWYGTLTPVVTTANSTEPGYAAQIPVAFGGAAVPPGGQPDIAGPASANIVYLPFLSSGADNDGVEIGFQPAPNTCNGCLVGGLVTNTNTGEVYCSIQAAIDDPLTLDGHTITVAAGTYTENVTVNKRLKIIGAGSSLAGTVVQGVGGLGDVFTYTAGGSGLSGTPASLEKMYLTGASKGVYLGTNDYINLDDLDLVGLSTYGIELFNNNNINITNSLFTAGASGIRLGSTASANTLLINGCTFSNNSQQAIHAFASATGGLTNVTITNNTITDCGVTNNMSAMYFEKLSNANISNNMITNTGPSTNPRGIVLNMSTAAYSNVTIASNTLTENRTPVASLTAGYAIRFAGFSGGSLSSINVLSNNIDGYRTGVEYGAAVDRPSIQIKNNLINNVQLGILSYSGTSSSSTMINDNSFTNLVTGASQVPIPSPFAILNADAAGTPVSATCNWYGTANEVTIASLISSNVSYCPWLVNGTDNAPATGFQPVPGSCTGAIGGGLVTNTNTGETFCSIQLAIDDAQTLDGHTIEVGPGTYAENVTVSKSLTIRSSGGKAVTTVTGSSGSGVLGTFLITADNVTIGGPGQGFTINGYDSPSPGIEYAAVYIQGVRNNITIRGNQIVADGEGGLVTESGNAVNNLTVNANMISGKTFTGAEAGDCGFSNQFTATNVPRQLVVIPTGSGVTFTSNMITGTAGSTSTVTGCTTLGQGNTLVTIDANNATIQGNTFAGTTTRFGSSLRVRGTGASVSCNSFDNTGLGLACVHIVFNGTSLGALGTPNTLAGVASANTFLNEGAYFTGATQIYRSSAQVSALPQTPIAANTVSYATVTNTNTGISYCSIQDAINDVNTLNGHIIEVGPGTYAETVTLIKSLTLSGPNALTACPGTRLPEAIITGGLNISNGASLTVTVEGFHFQGVSSPMNYNGNVGTATLTAAFRNNLVNTNSGQLAVFTGNATNNADLTITGNCFQNMATNAIQIGASTSGGVFTAQITDNTINTTGNSGINADGITNSNLNNNSISSTAQQGIQLAGPSGTVNINGNVITNANTGLDANRGGIRLRGGSYNGSVDVLNNIISGSVNGVIVPTGENITGKTINVNNNNLSGNTFGVKNSGTGTLNATCNWYGTAVGATVATLVSGSVTFSPFLVDGTDSAPATGFQPLPNTCSGCTIQPRLETSINGVVVTSDNNGTMDAGSFTVCNGTPNNVVINNFTELNGVAPTTHLRVYQTVTLTNATLGYCNNCQALLSAFTPGYQATLALVDPSMPGSAVVSFRLWNDDILVNGQLDNGECSSDLIQYTISINPLPSLQTTINTVQVTSNNDGTDDTGTFSVCDASANNLFFTSFADLTGATPANKVKVIQEFTRTNVTFGPGDFVFLLSDYSPAFDRNVALVDPTMPGTLVMRFRIFYDSDDSNTFNTGDCANDWIVYTVTVNTLPTANITGNTLVCTGTSITLNGNPSGGSGTYSAHGWIQTGGTGSVTITNNNDGSASILGVTAGSVTLQYTVTDNETCTGSAVYTITVNDCGSISLVNNKNPGDPCSCNNDQTANGAQNGTFGETVSVTPTTNVEIWTVVAISRLAVSGGMPTGIAIGNTLTDMGGFHAISFQHVDDAGYTITVEGPNAVGSGGNTQLTVSNICQYPVIAFDPTLPDNVCLNSTPITLTVSEANSFVGMSTFTVDGNAATTFDPSAPLTPPGPYPVVANFTGTFVSNTGGTVATPAFPGCQTSISDAIGIYSGPAVTCPGPIVLNTNSDDTGDCDAAQLLNHPAIGTSCATTLNIAFANGAPAPPYLPTGGMVTPGGSGNYAFAAGQTIVTYTATDAANNVSSCMFTVTVTDNEAPTITCPAPVILTVPNGQCSMPISYNTPTTTDNCSSTVALINGFASGTVLSVGLYNMIWQATDASGNSTSCSFNVTVRDDQAPALSCPANISVPTEPGKCTAVVNYATPVVTENCSGWSLALAPGSLPSGSAFPKGSNTVQWKVTDAGGLMSTCSFTVTVSDNQPLTITCPTNIVKSADANCQAQVFFALKGISDNCPGIMVSIQGTAPTTGLISGSLFPKGVTTVTYQATDGATLMTTCSFTVTVNDVTAPSITCPVNQTKNTDANVCTAVINYALMVVVSDNCPNPTWAAVTPSHASGSAFNKGVTTVVLRATDGAGLTKTCTFRVTVNDRQAPAITCAADQSVNTGAGQCSAVVTYTDATFTDNCAPTNGTAQRMGGLPSGAAFPKGVTNVVYRATDASGNFALCTVKITVTDNEKPKITCPTVPNRNTDPGKCSAVVSYSTPTSTDNCPGVQQQLLSGLASGSNFPVGSTTVRWQAKDAVGLTEACEFTVTVVDNQAPTITCPPNTTIMGGPGACTIPKAQLPTATAQDNCGVTSLTSNAPATVPAGTITVTWTALDAANLQAQCQHTVTVMCGTSYELGVMSYAKRESPSSLIPHPLYFTLSPNPASESVLVLVSGIGEAGAELNLYDALGRQVWRKTLVQGVEQIKIDLTTNEFTDGMYQVTLRTEDKVITKSLVVTKR